MKKKILFVIESLVCAGAEKSLVTLLSVLDYTRYDVYLQLFSYGGEFESLVPKEVHILPPLHYFSSIAKPMLRNLVTEPKIGVCRLRYSIVLRCGKHNNPQKAVLFWQKANSCFKRGESYYDIAIAYAQGTPTFYVADCVNAKQKFAWVNASYRLDGEYREYVEKKYRAYDKVNCVSESAKEIFETIFPEHAHKSVLIYDINDYKTIEKLSNLPSQASIDMRFDGVKILTVGRLAMMKGYDIAVEACRILKERGFYFRWYALGRGALEKEIAADIREKGLEDDFILLGTRANPYPYYLQADIYVQTSKFEGFGLAIAEARMLNVPVVTTRFDAVYAQMIDDENGVVVDISPEAVADGIQRLIEDKELYQHIRQYQMHEKKGNTEEIEKFYMLVEGKL